jgi:hypothetical protein
LTHGQQIEIDQTRTPTLATHATKFRFNSQEIGNRLMRGERRGCQYRRIRIGRLLFWSTHRRRLPQLTYSLDAPMSCQLVQHALQHQLRLALIGSKSYKTFSHEYHSSATPIHVGETTHIRNFAEAV